MPRGTSPAAAAATVRNQAVKAAVEAQQDHTSVPAPVVAQDAPQIPEGVSTQTGELATALALILPSIVASEVKRALADSLPRTQLVTDTTEFSVPAEPHQFKATFRCDKTPNLQRQKFDAERASQEGVPFHKYPMNGQFIEFHNGIYQTDDDNEVLQLRWASNNIQNTGGPMGHTVGGNRDIYEVSGQIVLRCPHKGCNFAATSQQDVDGHFRATHG